MPEETTRTGQAKSTMAKRSLRVNDEASRNTKLVKTRSKSKHEAGQKERPKRKAKASGKRRQNRKTSEVEDHRNPETKAAERRVGQQRDVPKRITKGPPGGSLPRHTEKSTEKSTAKSPSQVLPTSQQTTWM